MTAEECLEQLNALREGSITQIEIDKEIFLTFRSVLIQQDDFKHFIGKARHGGKTIYTYQKNSN